MSYYSFLKNHWRFIILIILSVFFFTFGSFYIFQSTQENKFLKFSSPDETANYFFTKLYAEKNKLQYSEPLNGISKNIVHPRSIGVVNGYLVPMSFLGIILVYGIIAKFTSLIIIPYLTLFFALIGVLFFYGFVKNIFSIKNKSGSGSDIAFVSAMLMFCLTPYWYYSLKPMFHNVLFIVLLIIGLFFLTNLNDSKLNSSKIQNWKANLFLFLSGIFIGLAIITRISELLWLLPVLIIIGSFNIKKLDILKITLFLSGIFLTILLIFYYNQILYNNPFKSGYPEMNKVMCQTANETFEFIFKHNHLPIGSYFTDIKSKIFYFGWHPREAFLAFSHYWLEMFYWLSLPSILGILIFIIKKRYHNKKRIFFLISYVLASIILIIYYGSWVFHDNPDPTRITIGNSYTRYWLPIYVFSLPFASIFILKFLQLLKKRNLRYLSLILILFIFSCLFYPSLMWNSEEGLGILSSLSAKSFIDYKQIINLTKKDGIIITIYGDKLMFPQRRIVYGKFDDKNMIKQYANLAKFNQLYYYGFSFRQKDLDYLNNRKLKQVNLGIRGVKRINKDMSLYKLVKIKNKQE